MENPQRLQGRLVRPEEVVWLRESIAANPMWSRKRIAQEVCTAWGWRDGAGRPKDFAARSLLLKLAALGAITLPALRRQKQTGWRGQSAGAEPIEWREPVFLESPLECLRPLSIEVVAAGSPAHRRWSFYLTRYHYLGLRVVGENLGYLVCDREGRDVACLLFGAAAWRCAPRDRLLEWSQQERAAKLPTVANNSRFLILPWLRCANLASHVLATVARRIDGNQPRRAEEADDRRPGWHPAAKPDLQGGRVCAQPVGGPDALCKARLWTCLDRYKSDGT